MDDKGEHRELAAIYVGRGLDPALAKQVADQLMAHDALEAHARDELGITQQQKARPVQAALASAASFAVGTGICSFWSTQMSSDLNLGARAVPVFGSSFRWIVPAGSSLAGAMRVTFWGALAMAVTSGVGSLFGVAV